jgi:hypothetical protein
MMLGRVREYYYTIDCDTYRLLQYTIVEHRVRRRCRIALWLRLHKNDVAPALKRKLYEGKKFLFFPSNVPIKTKKDK